MFFLYTVFKETFLKELQLEPMFSQLCKCMLLILEVAFSECTNHRVL